MIAKYRAGYQKNYTKPGQVITWSGFIEAPGWREFWCPHRHFSKAAALKCAEKELVRVRRYGLWR